jgi:hypothetical protein
MLVDLESGLVAALRASPLAPWLRAIDALPDLEGDRLISRFGADAPAVYVALGSGDFPAPGVARAQIGLACVCRNARGGQSARQGDGLLPGLFDLVASVVTLLSGDLIDGHEYELLRWDLLSSEALDRQGLVVAIVQARTTVLLPIEIPVGVV